MQRKDAKAQQQLGPEPLDPRYKDRADHGAETFNSLSQDQLRNR